MTTQSLERALQIGEVAKGGDVTVETVRYYERRGLLNQAERTASSGYRSFPTEAVRRLRFIRRAQTLGFSLGEIGELLDLGSKPGARAVEVREKVDQKLADVRQKIDDLRRIASSLEQLSESCDGEGEVSDCVILDALNAE